MLSIDENQLITRTGPGTPMGELFRRYWLPAMLSEELPEPDCPPVSFKLLGEELVEDGLRCVYHGWKFDVDGNCVDMPNEPPTSRFNEKVKITAYQAVEKGGVIWFYLGPRDRTPAIPDLEWTRVPESHRLATKRIQFCNYLQNLEGEVDSSHVSFLHSRFTPVSPAAEIQPPVVLAAAFRDPHPVFDVKETDYGLAISARRDSGEEDYYWRITQFLMPTYTMIPANPDGPLSFTAAIPIDDETMIGLTIDWRPDGPLTEADVSRIKSWLGVHTEVDENYIPVRNKTNQYMIDRAAQRRGESYTGIRGIREQDLAVQEDQRGPISERSREHLGTSDMGVIAVRRRLLRQLRALQQGEEPAEPNTPEVYAVRSVAITEKREIPWETAAAKYLNASNDDLKPIAEGQR
jgi:phthalate 4,5-dioxygenase oxygenase subunit